MSELLWPGDERAGTHLTDAAVLAALLRVEQVWLDSLVRAGVAPGTGADLSDASASGTCRPSPREPRTAGTR